MWGRKDKQKRGERRKGGGASKGGPGLPFMGLGVPPGILLDDNNYQQSHNIFPSHVMLGADESEEALEAELLALQGKSPKGKKSSGKGTKVMSMKDIDSMVAGLDEMGEVRIRS